MTDTITIPPEAVEAAAKDLCRAMGNDPEDVQSDGENEWPLWWEFLKPARAALLAGLRAWPGMYVEDRLTPWDNRIILPLPQEPSDGK